MERVWRPKRRAQVGLRSKPKPPYNVVCSCGKNRGVAYVDTPDKGPWGFLFCPVCDWGDGNHGPPAALVARIKDVK
jgi:hypothetical protein